MQAPTIISSLTSHGNVFYTARSDEVFFESISS